MKHTQQLENVAKEMALAELNKRRAEKQFKPLNRLGTLWWKTFGDKWIEAAKERMERLSSQVSKEITERIGPSSAEFISDLPPESIDRETQHKILTDIVTFVGDTHSKRKREELMNNALGGAAIALQSVNKLPAHWFMNITCGRQDRLWDQINHSPKK